MSQSEVLDVLQPVETSLCRIGSPFDGGYVISQNMLRESEILVTFGVSTDWTFEQDFCNQRSKATNIVLCDRSSGSLSFVLNLVKTLGQRKVPIGLRIQRARGWFILAAKFLAQVRLKRWVFHRRWVVDRVVNHRKEVTGVDLLVRHCRKHLTLLKIDIEGGEYQVLPPILKLCRLNGVTLTGVILEFHNVDRHQHEVIEIVRDLRQLGQVVHVHPNNFSPVVDGVPSTLEVTISFVDPDSTELRKRLPLEGVDAPNNPQSPEIELVWK
jgi:hypothetical protein